MADSFSKKEREKKKVAKRKEKEERKQFRKDNPESSNPDNFSYVDEFGNVTSMPPDPTKRVEINTDDIVIGATKREAPDPADLIRTGTVSLFNTSKGYGFIRDDKSQESVFVHMSEIMEPIKEFNKVQFEVKRGPKGMQASNVRLAPKK